MRLAVIPGDGIGTEVVAEGLRVLSAVHEKVDTVEYDLGARRYHASAETLPGSVLAELREADAILLGAIGDPSVPSGVLERGLLLRLRFELDHHVNLRPVKLYPGVTSPLAGDPDIDFVVVREGTEGPYAGVGGSLRKDTPHEVANEESVNTRYGVERVVRDAFRRAQARERHLTMVHKTNVLTHAGGLWSRTVDAVAPDFPDVTVEYQHADAASMFFVTQPSRFDVIVTDNLFGDILTDIGAAIAGGIGLAASGNLDVSRTNPSMFEPVHGSAPDIAGQGVADPTATVLSVAMLLEHLGHADEAKRVEAAVAADLAGQAGLGSGSRRSTREVGEALAARAAG
jgi:3-isopropylmalate dehydrogenase